MLEINIPGFKTYTLRHLVMDYNGTLAQDGLILDGVHNRLISLSESLHLHIITADTFGVVQSQVKNLSCELVILPLEQQASAKLAYIQRLDETQVVAIGNGRNDHQMLHAAALGIAVLQGEGAATDSCLAADVLTPSILIALDLLLCPKRLIAILRS